MNFRFCFTMLVFLALAYGRNYDEYGYESDEPVVRSSKSSKLTDCSDTNIAKTKKNGVYWVNLGDHVREAYCEVGSDDNIYTVFQRRLDGSVSFFRRWKNYKEGFGNISGEFWWGLAPLSTLTTKYRYKLRVELEAFDKTKVYAEYDDFSVGDEDSKFTLRVGGYTGTAGDALSYHNNMAFSTIDSDNDKAGENCASTYHGAWWYNACHQSNLNGLYFLGKHTTFADGIDWLQFRTYLESMKSTKMMITRK